MSKGKSQPKKLTAAQRIEGLENALSGVMRNNQILAGEIDNLRQTLGALARRLNATIASGEQGTISNDAVNDIITQENIAELKGKVDFLLEQGVIEPAKEGSVHERSFLVGRELDEDRNIINPRIQFAVASILPEVKDLLLGKKVGDVVKNQDDGLLLEVTELFDIPEKVEKNLEESQEASE